MQKLFTKILLPVAFNRNTRWSVEKAIQLANKFGCDILLLHVQSPPSVIPISYRYIFSDPPSGSTKEEACRKLNELAQQCRPKLKEGLLLTTDTRVGHWQSVLKDVIITEHIDLAMIPRSRKTVNSMVLRRININKLSQQTSCPIMTLTRGFNPNHLEHIVVPVQDALPVKKLTMATYLSLETSGSIYLMGTNENATVKTGDACLMKAYQLLNDFGVLNIHCALRSNDAAAGTLAYANDIHANLIVVNPGQESRWKGWWNKLRGKYLCRESDIPVLTVAP